MASNKTPSSAKPDNAVRLADVADEAGVSLATASMALTNTGRISPLTRRRVWAASRRLGYQRPTNQRGEGGPARHEPALRPVKRIGCVCLGRDFRRPIVTSCLGYLAAAVSRQQIRMETACFEDLGPRKAVEQQLLRFAEHLDGLVLMGMVDEAVMRCVSQHHLPAVVLGDPTSQQAVPLDVVTFDQQSAGRQATAHLIRQGHRRIGLATDTLYPGGGNAHWREGYQLAHIDAGITPDPALVRASGTVDGGAEELLAYFRGLDEPPTAYLILNQYLAEAMVLGFIQGGDQPAICRVCADSPPVTVGNATTINYPLQAVCDAAISRLLSVCGNPGQPPSRVVVPFDAESAEA